MNSEVIKDKLLEKKYGIKCNGYGDYDGYHIGGYRYKLEIIITNSNNDKTLDCIMMNPSTTFPNNEWNDKNWQENLGFKKFDKKPKKTVGFDPTVRNVIRMAYSKGYSKVCIFNLFPYIHPTGKIAIESFKKKQIENKRKLREWALDSGKVLIAWGNDLPEEDDNKYEYLNLQKEYINIFRNEKKSTPVCYEWNEEKLILYHPSPYNNSLTKNNEGKIVRKEKNDGKPSIIQQFIDSDRDFEPIKDVYFENIEKIIDEYNKKLQ